MQCYGSVYADPDLAKKFQRESRSRSMLLVSNYCYLKYRIRKFFWWKFLGILQISYMYIVELVTRLPRFNYKFRTSWIYFYEIRNEQQKNLCLFLFMVLTPNYWRTQTCHAILGHTVIIRGKHKNITQQWQIIQVLIWLFWRHIASRILTT
jgi:hypothetical protein